MCLRIPVFRYFSVTPTNLFLAKIQTPKTFRRTQSKNFHARVWKVSLKNTTAWKIKSLTSSLVLSAPTKLAQISVGSEQDEAEIQYNRWSTPEWCNCEKCEKISTS